MSLVRRVARFVKTVLQLSGSPLFLSVPGRLPGSIQIVGDSFSVVDTRVLEDEMRVRGVHLDAGDKIQFDQSVGSILSGVPAQVSMASETLQVLGSSPPLQASSSIHVNSAVAHALVGDLNAAETSIIMASTTLEGLTSHEESIANLRRSIRDNATEIQARKKRFF